MEKRYTPCNHPTPLIKSFQILVKEDRHIHYQEVPKYILLYYSSNHYDCDHYRFF